MDRAGNQEVARGGKMVSKDESTHIALNWRL